MSTPQDFDGLFRWRCIGPFRGGRVVAVAGSYHDQNTFYFGGAAGGVWKSTDGGQYWQCVSDGFFATSAVGAIAVAPSDSNVVYAGTGETTIRIDVSHGDGVYKSTDAGRTWANVGLRDTRFTGKIRVHPNDPDTVWVAALGHAFGPNAERGVFKSVDGGKSWKKTLFVSDKAGAVDLTVDPHNPRLLYAAVWEAYRNFWMISSGGPESGLWQSNDAGETWENIADRQGLPKATLGKIGVAASAKAGRVWALIEHRTEGGLYRSDDYGATWERVCDNQNLVSRAWYYTHITADPVDGETVYVNNLDFWKSTDGGRTFSQINTPHGDNHDLWIDPKNNQRMIQGNDGGATVSFNGGYSFSTIYNQPTAQFYHLATDSKDPYTVFGTQQDNSSIAVPSRVNHAGITNSETFVAGTGESGYIAVRPDDSDILYVGAIGSSPGGGNALQRYDRRRDQIRLITTWPEFTRGTGAGEHKYRFAWTYPIVISPHDPKTIYVGGNIVFKSTDEGQSWRPISPDLSKADPETLKATGGPVNLDAVGAEIFATVFSLVESQHERGLLWAGTDDGVIYVSGDEGKAWHNVTPKDLPEWTLISGIEVSPFHQATVYVAGTRYKADDYKPYLYVTRDYGESWKQITNGIPDDAFTRVIRCDPVTPGLLYAGTETGLYVSFDDGANWQSIQGNLPVTPIHELLIKNDDLIAGTHGRSIWILDDLTPLRAIAKGETDGAYLSQPRDTVRILPGVDWSDPTPGTVNYLGSRWGAYLATKTADGEMVRTNLDMGENPPRGALITYRLAVEPAEPITLSFHDQAGNELRSFGSRKDDDPAIAKERRVPAKAGWNRFVWDLQIAPATKIEGDDPAAKKPVPGPYIPPGSYTVKLKNGSEELSRTFTVVKPGAVDTSQEDLEAQYELSTKIHRQIDRTAKAINRMRDLRQQLSGWATRADDLTNGSEIVDRAKSFGDKVLEIEQTLLVPDLRDGWADAINNGARLWDKLLALPSVPAMGDYRPTGAAAAVLDDLTTRIDAQIAVFDALVAAELPGFNALVSNAQLGAVVAKPS
jgi:photosystem II stability/assembly factor-like uncharacterized protein